MKRILMVLAILIWALPSWAKDDECQPVDVYVRSAKIYMGAQQKIPDFKSAQKQLDKAVECYPDAVEPQYLLSIIFYKKRMYDEFLGLAKSIDTLDVERKFMDTVWQMRQAAWGELFNRGVDSLKASNDLDVTRAEAQAADQIDLYDSLTTVGRGYLESAKGLFLASLEMDSTRSEPYQNLGVIDVRLQNWDEALVWYRRSLETSPGDRDILRNIVSLNMRTKSYDSAMHYVRIALSKDSAKVTRRNEQGAMDTLVVKVERGSLPPDLELEALMTEAALYAQLGFPDSANMVFEEIIAKDPSNKDVLFNLAMTQVQNAQSYSDEIQRHSQRANELAKEHNRLAANNAKESELKSVRDKQQAAVTAMKEDKGSAEVAWGKAAGLLQQFADLDSTDHEAYYFLGLSRFWLENDDSAQVVLSRAVALVPDYCEAWQVLYYSYMRSKDSPNAALAKEELDKCQSQ